MTETKALIVAAGLGSRLKHLTKDLPKCMLDFGGKTLLERQISVYKNCGINNISVVRGYKKNKIQYKNLTYFDNDDYENNNILNSIFYAEKILERYEDLWGLSTAYDGRKPYLGNWSLFFYVECVCSANESYWPGIGAAGYLVCRRRYL